MENLYKLFGWHAYIHTLWNYEIKCCFHGTGENCSFYSLFDLSSLVLVSLCCVRSFFHMTGGLFLFICIEEWVTHQLLGSVVEWRDLCQLVSDWAEACPSGVMRKIKCSVSDILWNRILETLNCVYVSVQFSCSVVSDSLWLHGLQHTRPPCPSQLPEFIQTHVHWFSDAIQPSHPLSLPSPPAFNLAQHQGLYKWVSSSHKGAKVLEFQL